VNQAIINTLSIETWDLVELENLHQRVFHLKRPEKMLPRNVGKGVHQSCGIDLRDNAKLFGVKAANLFNRHAIKSGKWHGYLQADESI